MLAGWPVLAALLALLGSAQGQCLLGLDIDPSKSAFKAGGQLIEPLPADIIVNNTQQLSLAGKLFLTFPTGTCPTTPQAFASGLPGATVTTPSDADPVRIQPSSFQAQVGQVSLATVTFTGIEFNLSSPPLPALPATPANGAYGTTLFSQVVNGSSSVQTSLPIAGTDGGDSSVEMNSLTTNSSVLISVYSTAGNGVRLTFSNFNFTYVSSFTTMGIQGEASYYFAGSVQASAVLGCEKGCGSHGACQASGNSKSCKCECGYGGSDCSQADAQAVCPGRAAASSVAPAPAKAAAKAPAPAAKAAAPAAAPKAAAAAAPNPAAAGSGDAIPVPVLSGGSAAGGSSASPSAVPPPMAQTTAALPQAGGAALPKAGGSSSGTGGGLGLLAAGSLGASAELDPKANIAVCQHGATPACDTCQAGWQGSNCDACTTSQVCQASLQDSSATCNTGFDYTKHTVFKSYVCDYSQTVLAGLLTPQRGFWIGCNTTSVRNDQGESGGYCRLGLRLQSNPDNPIQCTASACQFKEGSSKIQCKKAVCACPQGSCPDVATSYLDMIQNKDITADCDKATGNCNIVIQDFPIQLETPCKAGDCVSDKNPTLNSGEFTSSQHRDYSAVIAAIPIMALLALCLVAALVTAFGAAFRAAKHGGTPKTAGALVAAGGKGRVSRTPQNPIRILRFEHVSCSVPGSRFSADHWGIQGQQHAAIPLTNGHAESGMEKGISQGQNGHMENGNGYGNGNAVLVPGQQRAVGASYRDSPVGGSGVRSMYMKKKLCARAFCRQMCGKRPRVNILDNATGQAKMGELVGVLGPSGCGKTTLLSILAGSVSSLSASSHVCGNITLDGQPRKSWASRLVAYVPQFDFLLPTLTVAETLRYSALLRLPRDAQGHEVQARVEGVLEELGLEHVASSQVGGSSGIRGVSGGERRRVTIGMELVIDPSILVLDEPTSGLDSYTAVKLMESLKGVASAGRIVILSLHQPSEAMFDQLDRAFLMARGRVVYSGEPDAAPTYFYRAGLSCPERTAIAEHMLACVSDPVLLSALMKHVDANGPYYGRAAAEFTEQPGSANGYASPEKDGRELSTAAPAPDLPQPHQHTKPPRTPLGRELAVLFWRTLTEIIRNPTLLAMHCAMAIIMGTLCGGIFYHIGNDIAGAQNRLGAVFFSLVFLALTSLTTVDLLVNERGLVVKESLGGYYRPVSYYLSKATLDGLLLRVLPAVLYSIPFYPMIGFQPGASHVALFFCVLAVFSATVGALSMAITVGFGTAGKAALIMNLVLLLSLLFTGYLVNIAAVTPVLQWVHYLSVFFFGFEGLIVNEMSGISLIFAAQGVSVTITGDLFLQLISVNTNVLVRDVLVLDAYFFYFVICGIALLYFTLPRPLVVRRPRQARGPTFPSSRIHANGVSHSASASSFNNDGFSRHSSDGVISVPIHSDHHQLGAVTHRQPYPTV